MKTWYVYLIRCCNGNLYTGITTDVSRRLSEHVSGKKGAKSLRGKGPLILIYQKKIGCRSAALKEEYRVKRLSKKEKELFILSRTK